MSETGKQYRRHLEVLDGYLADAIERAANASEGAVEVEGVLFHAGPEQLFHADDHPLSHRATPHLQHWVPLDGPDHCVLARPGEKPLVMRICPQDFWFDTSPPPPSYWEASVELIDVDDFDQVAKGLGSLERVAYVGPDSAAAAKLGIADSLIEPAALMAPLDWHRAIKTDYEISRLELATKTAAGGHAAAREAFDNGATERQIHWTFLAGSDQLEREVPYGTIIALDEKAAILHYQQKRGPRDVEARTLLIDAGSAWQGYAIDVTRTWTTAKADAVFVDLVRGMDAIERDLVAMVTVGRSYPDIHLEAHRRIVGLLGEHGIIRAGVDEAIEHGLGITFMPHGVGHHLGLQVHDVGGHQAGPDGGRIEPPDGHPFLRNTRTLEVGHVVTIEPGLYFIPMLLDPLRESDRAHLIDWKLVDRLIPHGGIRIEDNIVCTEDGPRDLTRGSIPSI